MGIPPYWASIKPQVSWCFGALRHRPTPQSAHAQISGIGRSATLASIMASIMAAQYGQFIESNEGAERLKLERLRELRAVIDSLRHECESQDPLLAWVIARENAENRHHD
jgi:hypothetical protein